jgi:hypothetical protein
LKITVAGKAVDEGKESQRSKGMCKFQSVIEAMAAIADDDRMSRLMGMRPSERKPNVN